MMQRQSQTNTEDVTCTVPYTINNWN